MCVCVWGGRGGTELLLTAKSALGGGGGGGGGTELLLTSESALGWGVLDCY